MRRLDHQESIIGRARRVPIGDESSELARKQEELHRTRSVSLSHLFFSFGAPYGYRTSLVILQRAAVDYVSNAAARPSHT